MSEFALLLEQQDTGQRTIFIGPEEMIRVAIDGAVASRPETSQLEVWTPAELVIRFADGDAVTARKVELPDGYLNHVHSYIESLRGGDHGSQAP